MAGHVRRFTSIQNSTSGASIQTKRVPCYLARCVIFRVTSAVSEAAASLTLIVAPSSNLGQAGASIAGQGYAQRGTLPNNLSFGPGTVTLAPLDAATPITHPWCDLLVTSGSTFTGPVNIDVDVVYDSEAAMQRGEQLLLGVA